MVFIFSVAIATNVSLTAASKKLLRVCATFWLSEITAFFSIRGILVEQNVFLSFFNNFLQNVFCFHVLLASISDMLSSSDLSSH